MSKQDDEFICGFAAALACLARQYDRPSVAVEILHSNGLTLRHLRRAKVDSYDLEPIAREYKAQRLNAQGEEA